MISRKQIAVAPSHNDRWRKILRLAWYPAFAAVLGIFVASIPGFFIIGPGGIAGPRFSANSSPLILSLAWIVRGAAMATGVLSLFLALLLFRRRSDDRMALLTSFFLLAHGVIMPGPLEGLKAFFPEITSSTAVLIPASIVFLTLLLFAVFPDGRFVPRWTRWAVLVAFLATLFTFYWTSQFGPSPLDFSHPAVLVAGGVTIVLMVAMWISILYAQVYRYRHVSTLRQKQQTKWVLYGVGVWFGFQMIMAIPWAYALSLPPGAELPLWLVAASPFWILSIAVIPVTLTIAIMRDHLFDIDIIINRTLVYGALTVSVAGLYTLIVAGGGLLVQTDLSLVGLLVTALLVGVFFRPLRSFLQRAADRVHQPVMRPSAQSSGERARSSPQTGQSDQSVDPKWGRVLKPLWIVAAVLSFGVLILSLPGYVTRTPIGNLGSHLVFKPTTLLLALHHLNSVISILSAVISLSLAALLFIKISDQRMGLFLAFYLLAHGVLLAGPIEMLESFWPNVARVNSFYLLPIYAGPATTALVGLFPDGRFIPRWSRWLIPVTLLFLLASFLLERGKLPLGSGLSGWILTGVVIVLLLVIFVAILYVSIYRYRHVSTPEQRQQTKWVIYGLFLWFVFLLISVIPLMMVLNLPTGSLVPWWVPVAQLFWFLSIAIFPLTLTIAVMRYRLYEIDILINRTLVYGALTVSVIAVYTLVVGAASVLFQSSGNLVVSLLATGLVAVLFQPLRERLQAGVNHLLYGERADPFAVMTDLARRLENAKNPNDMLAESVRTVARALKLPYVAIVSGQDRRDDVVAAWGNPAGEPVEFPLIYQAETVGYLLVSPRAPGEAFDEVEQNLLRTIARQAGALVHAVRLTDDLKRSRRRIVSAREEERRRLRRDLHDGLGASLAALHLQTGVLRRLIRKDQGAAEEIVGEFRDELREAIDEIRRVVYELRPPALDELGLVPAIQAQAARCSQPNEVDNDPGVVLQVRVEAPEALPALPAAVEVAAFRIVQEALTNVVRHAQARYCFVRLELDGDLQVEVVDDGVGIKDRHTAGVGLISMCERATELGGTCVIESAPNGGTRVRACLPLSQE